MGFFSKLFGEPADPDARRVTAPTPDSFAGKRIFLVSPSITVSKVIELALDGAQVTMESDGVRAMERLRSEPYDLVIGTDVDGLSVYDLCTHVKSIRSGVPVVLLRPPLLLFDESRAREVKADLIQDIPFKPDAFAAEIARILKRRI